MWKASDKAHQLNQPYRQLTVHTMGILMSKPLVASPQSTMPLLAPWALLNNTVSGLLLLFALGSISLASVCEPLPCVLKSIPLACVAVSSPGSPLPRMQYGCCTDNSPFLVAESLLERCKHRLLTHKVLRGYHDCATFLKVTPD